MHGKAQPTCLPHLRVACDDARFEQLFGKLTKGKINGGRDSHRRRTGSPKKRVAERRENYAGDTGVHDSLRERRRALVHSERAARENPRVGHARNDEHVQLRGATRSWRLVVTDTGGRSRVASARERKVEARKSRQQGRCLDRFHVGVSSCKNYRQAELDRSGVRSANSRDRVWQRHRLCKRGRRGGT